MPFIIHDTDGSACYTDKSVAKSGDKAYWTIAKVEAEHSEAYVALEAEIATAEEQLAAAEKEDGKEEFQAAIAAAKEQLGKTDEEMTAALEALKAAEEAFAAAQAGYITYILTEGDDYGHWYRPDVEEGGDPYAFPFNSSYLTKDEIFQLQMRSIEDNILHNHVNKNVWKDHQGFRINENDQQIHAVTLTVPNGYEIVDFTIDNTIEGAATGLQNYALNQDMSDATVLGGGNIIKQEVGAKEFVFYLQQLPADQGGGVIDVVFKVNVCEAEAGPEPAVFETGKYFLKNIATGKYWGAANDWGTHASLVDNPEFMVLTRLEDGTYTLETNVNNGGTQYYFNGDWMDNGNPLHLTITDYTDYFTIGNGTIYYGYNGQNTKMGNDSNNSTDPADENVKWQIVGEAEIADYLAQATAEEPINATFFLKDANFGRNNRDGGGDNNDRGNAWTGTGVNNWSGGINENKCAESFHQDFNLSQTIEGVPNGIYSVTLQGFYRVDEGATESRPVVFINDAEAVFSERTGTENNMDAASNAFLAGNYISDMAVAEVTDGTLNIGAKLEGNANL